MKLACYDHNNTNHLKKKCIRRLRRNTSKTVILHWVSYSFEAVKLQFFQLWYLHEKWAELCVEWKLMSMQNNNWHIDRLICKCVNLLVVWCRRRQWVRLCSAESQVILFTVLMQTSWRCIRDRTDINLRETERICFIQYFPSLCKKKWQWPFLGWYIKESTSQQLKCFLIAKPEIYMKKYIFWSYFRVSGNVHDEQFDHYHVLTSIFAGAKWKRAGRRGVQSSPYHSAKLIAT